MLDGNDSHDLNGHTALHRVVTALQGDQNGISLVIRNTGDAPTTAAFWVDVYINPSRQW